MWRSILVLFLSLMQSQHLWAQVDLPAISPEDCSLECVLQGGPGCNYCRINRRDVERTRTLHSPEAFGSCVPWPCLVLLGDQSPDGLCQHYIQAPREVTIQLLPDQNPKYDTVVISWKPSQYGIAFLRGFQVTLQALGGSHISCQLFLFQRNLSLPASHAQRVFKSDPFPKLALGAQYAVTVMALPVPEPWDRFYHSKIFSTRSCSEKNGLELCKKDWYPRHIEVQQEGPDIIVTFNLAPPNLEIRHYFSLCYGKGLRRYTAIIPNSTNNKTHYSYNLIGLQEGTNYTCEIGADEVDAVRKTFNVQVMHLRTGASLAPPATASPSLAMLLPVGLALTATVMLLLAGLTGRRPKLELNTLDRIPDTMEHDQDKSATHEEVTSLTSSRTTPPRLLICYSSHDGPAHIRAVMQLAAFLQQHMATQVCLDLWDSLSLAEEGLVAWHCSRLQQSDFVLVLCSGGLCRQHTHPGSSQEEEEEEESGGWDHSPLAVAFIAEELGRAKAKGSDLSKYMTAIFEYSEEGDVPAGLRLASGYTLPRDLALLFSQLHGVALHSPGGFLKIEHISEEGYAKLPAGAALRWAIHEAALELRGRQQRGVEGGSDIERRVEAV